MEKHQNTIAHARARMTSWKIVVLIETWRKKKIWKNKKILGTASFGWAIYNHCDYCWAVCLCISGLLKFFLIIFFFFCYYCVTSDIITARLCWRPMMPLVKWFGDLTVVVADLGCAPFFILVYLWWNKNFNEIEREGSSQVVSCWVRRETAQLLDTRNKKRRVGGVGGRRGNCAGLIIIFSIFFGRPPGNTPANFDHYTIEWVWIYHQMLQNIYIQILKKISFAFRTTLTTCL